MTKLNTENISSNHLSSDELLRYHRHLLSKEEMDAVKQHLHGCELCSDALNGMAEMQDAKHIYDITHEIRMRMKKRVSVRRKIFSGLDLLSIILILFILGLIILLAFYFLYLKW
jgi:hypothetical protein